jgi:hypothetical protein
MRPPAHLRAAVRIMDRCGVDEAVVGDMLELYESRPSAFRLWREVAMALAARTASVVTHHKPQTIRLLATAGAAIGLFLYLTPRYPHVDLASTVRVEDVSGGWLETETGMGRTRLLPTVTFQLRNVSAAPLSSVQVNVLFRRMGDNTAWSDVYRLAVSRTALESGTSTAPIVVQAPVGYTGDEAAARLFAHSAFIDAAVAIYARHGSEGWTYMGEYPLPRNIIARRVESMTRQRTMTSYRIK